MQRINFLIQSILLEIIEGRMCLVNVINILDTRQTGSHAHRNGRYTELRILQGPKRFNYVKHTSDSKALL